MVTTVTCAERQALVGHPGFTLWLTGLSGAGKSTLALALERVLIDRGVLVSVLDGDDLRQGLCADLGFSVADRSENIRRVAEVARLQNAAGMGVICAFISPYAADRRRARGRHEGMNFLQAWVKCPQEVCEARDPKGLYRRARAGMILQFTGVSAPYEEPQQPDLELATAESDVASCVGQLVDELVRRGWVPTVNAEAAPTIQDSGTSHVE